MICKLFRDLFVQQSVSLKGVIRFSPIFGKSSHFGQVKEPVHIEQPLADQGNRK
jgi:hypothetical protein